MEKNWRHYLPFEDLGLRAPKRKNNDSVLYSSQEAVVKVVSEEISFGDLVLLAQKNNDSVLYSGKEAVCKIVSDFL